MPQPPTVYSPPTFDIIVCCKLNPYKTSYPPFFYNPAIPIPSPPPGRWR